MQRHSTMGLFRSIAAHKKPKQLLEARGRERGMEGGREGEKEREREREGEGGRELVSYDGKEE